MGPLQDLISRRTTVLITHDLHVARDAGRIAVLDAGRLVAVGSRRGARWKTTGLYARMWDLHDSNELIAA